MESLGLFQFPKAVPRICQKKKKDVSLRKVWRVFREGVCVGWLVGVMAVGSPVMASLTDVLLPENAIFDSAKIIPTSKRQQTNDDLLQFEKETGWRIRVFSAYQGESSYSDSDIREVWQPDGKTVIMAFDPSSPNIVAFRFVGDDVLMKLRRQFWVELQSRFGNLFFVRREGEAAAVDGIVNSVTECLRRPEGCTVVPGLPSDQFFATLGVSIAGGVVLGFSSKLEEGAWYQRMGWILAFSPLWLILFVNLGLGPVLSRTDDRLPVLANSAAFGCVALLFQFIDFPPKWMKANISWPDKESDMDD